MLRALLFVLAAAASLFSQSVYFVGSVENSMRECDLYRKASVYCYIAVTIKDEVKHYVNATLGEHSNMYDIDYNEIDAEQYDIVCRKFFLNSYSKHTMLILYFNKKAVQFHFDAKKTDLLQEFVNLGWSPLKARLEDFLKHNPNNQSALSMLLFRKLGELGNLNKETLPLFVKTFEKLGNASSVEFIDTRVALVALTRSSLLPTPAMLKESLEFQITLDNLMAKIEKELAREPYSFVYYYNWDSLAHMSQNPNPSRVLSQINFPPGNKDDEMGYAFARLANSLFNDDKEQIAFNFLNDAEKFIEAQDIPKGSFKNTLLDFAMAKIGFLVKCKRYSELEKYLRDLKNKIGSDWLEYVKIIEASDTPALRNVNIKKLPNSRRIEELLKSPTLDDGKKYFYGILIAHNFSQESFDKLHTSLSTKKVIFYLTQDVKLPKNSWTLKNANILIDSGSIVPNENKDDSEIGELLKLVQREERKNFNTLERFINQNPDNYEAVRRYCLEVVKFLPDESLEQKLFRYSSDTGIPPSVEAYSKIKNKDSWSRLASQKIAEGLIRLKDNPGSFAMNQLSDWEVLDISKNAIDWYGFFEEDTDFWYHPTYYMQPQIMHEAVFVKYLKCAENANDWTALLAACEARFLGDKKKCQNEQILKIWTQATEKVNVL